MRRMVEGFYGVGKGPSTALRAVPSPAKAGEELGAQNFCCLS